jgi:hypothetical protein
MTQNVRVERSECDLDCGRARDRAVDRALRDGSIARDRCIASKDSCISSRDRCIASFRYIRRDRRPSLL